MKKILAVIGSPRKGGNTDILVSKIAEGAAERGAQVEKLYLSDLEIQECDGCHVCWVHKRCSKDDDMCDVYPKIEESDVIIFGTPVYWYGPTALLKAFIDRFVFFNCPEGRKKIKGKSAVIAVPFEEDSPKTADLVVQFFEKSFEYLQMKSAGQILAPGVSKKGDILKKKDVLEKAYELGRKIA